MQGAGKVRGLDRFMYELLINGVYECEDIAEGGIWLTQYKPTEVTMTDLRTAARDYLKDHFSGHKAATFDSIERRVIEWFGATIELRKGKTNNGRWVIFPSLDDCRDHVRRTKGIEISAPDDTISKIGSITQH